MLDTQKQITLSRNTHSLYSEEAVDASRGVSILWHLSIWLHQPPLQQQL